MESPGGASAAPGGSVPAFLTKLWTLVEDPDTDALICWSPNGTSFHVFDQARFSKEVLPKFFKHNNMASFIRQLNMYGFRKVVHIEHGGLLKPEKDDTEFQHPFFVRGQDQQLENIKRKVTNVSSGRQEEAKMSSDDVNKILTDVQLMKGKQETIDSRIVAMKHENEALWREVASLRQKHTQQQKVVNKLIQFLVSLVQTNRVMGVKRKIPLMLNDSSSAHSVPKYGRQFSLEHMQAAANLFSADSPVNSGPIISDVTDVATPDSEEPACDWTEPGESQSVKEELSSPELEECPVLGGGATPVDTPLSPTTFINSFLQDAETHSSSASPDPAIVASPSGSQSPASIPTTAQQKCQTVACIDRPLPPPSAGGFSPDVWRFVPTPADKCELLDHVDNMESNLENLQNIFNAPTFMFEPSPLLEFFGSPSSSGDFDLDCLDNLLSDEVPKGSDVGSNTGKQLVQYSATPTIAAEAFGLGEGGADLPSLLEAEPFLATDTPADDLLSHAHLGSDL